jgi:hypothetical protein
LTTRLSQIIYICLWILAVSYFFLAIKLPLGTMDRPGPGFYPIGVGLTLIFLGSILLRRSFRKPIASESYENSFPQGENLTRVTAVTLVLFLFVLSLKPFGFAFCCFSLLVAVLKLLGMKGWMKIVIASLSVSIIFYFVFNNLLDIPLPLGKIFS